MERTFIVRRVINLRLLIDMDSVMADLMTPWYARYNKDYNDKLHYLDLTSWDTHKFVKKECGEKIYQYLHEPGFYRYLQPLPHSQAVMEKLNKEHEIFIVTTSPAEAVSDKQEWMKEHFPFIQIEHMIFTHRKDLIIGDLLFDDAPHNLEAFMATGRKAIAMNYPYNQSVNCDRVNNWLEFADYIAHLQEKTISV
ncbi:5' nucleotidase, NT5C type [Anaerobacillus sp. MEB173]|uniref:5' nucleotidase, NT5C type n=1 Tax=Anaerobacillus sp. MEB173 TaxID=3383345 RepID=UPI003F9250BE